MDNRNPINEPAPYVDWRKSGLALLILVAEIAIELLAQAFKINLLAQSIILSAAGLLTMVCMMYLYWDILRPAWTAFRTHLWRRLILLLLLSIGIKIVVAIIMLILALASPLKSSPTTTTNIAPIAMNTKALFFALTPFLLAAPFYEEIFYRHVLYYQWRARRGWGVIMLFISSVLFGLAHWSNVGGHALLTVPFMLLGLSFALIYRRQQNIWYNIITHFMYNASTVLLLAVGLLLV
ncbi:CPBP family intramembrane glutamic endopeptidase [Schleiferilactobacillus harbinensis]|uniref:CPBP family intramembrane glutamic endopeptidase n=1 Tax=Schleiferilactobacillus harbinensis TaxID=304207 RepID=UPI00116DA8F3|nr:type II CAAX endopeptidase family protein [Schleiferilactobacillus harbinensis]GEK07191.1 hypothetical protein LHA01_24300 [Schleiferilactobacillus harbinensis]